MSRKRTKAKKEMSIFTIAMEIYDFFLSSTQRTHFYAQKPHTSMRKDHKHITFEPHDMKKKGRIHLSLLQ